MKTQAVQILIRRSLASEPSDVVEAHEVPILRVIRGAGAITVVDDKFTGGASKSRKVKPREELIRLLNKYKSFVIDGQNPVHIAFPDGSRDLELFYKDPSAFDTAGAEDGGGVIGDEADAADEVFDDEGNLVTEDDPETPEVPVPDVGINLNDREAVVAKLAELGVPHAKTVATKHLATLLTKSLEPGAAE